MQLEHLGLIGNCQIAALVERTGSVVWCCLPRFDSEPVFSTLLDEQEGGQFRIGPPDGSAGTQRYLQNSNVLETTFETSDGAFRVIDFAPRFALTDRMFRPTELHRIVEPIDGTPRLRVSCDPRLGWSKRIPNRTVGSDHVVFEGYDGPLRVATDLPLSYLEGQPFVLTQRRHFILTWGVATDEPLSARCERCLSETLRYWQRWVKHCNIPPLYQEEVIRSALTLKLHCFEDTGAIVAAMTTSIPEAEGSGRNWDYRYCWLRDAYYVLGALRLLGHFEEREHFVRYLLGIAGGAAELQLAPLYRVDGTSDLEERVLTGWTGFGGHGPVRVGNGAAKHTQHDVFGEMVLALCPIFLDDRFSAERSPAVLRLLERMTRRAISIIGTPDAGIWEYRTEWRPQTFSSLMCWAAADRMSRVAARHAPNDAAEFSTAAERIRERMIREAYDPQRGGFGGSHGGVEVDAALLQMACLRFLPASDPRLVGTIEGIRQSLSRGGWIFRYDVDDGFGKPTVAFVVCTFWLIEALAVIGRMDEAKALMDRVRSAMSPLGLLSEDYDTLSGRMWGNFPQGYSHVGLIHAAFAASPRWSDVL